ncbi:MAG: OsmC family protein [Proteobacteria bacterium]|nr:OsmC family protein [Pseudomonadota bacterium]
MVRMELVYEGGLRCAARHVPSSSALSTDAPVDNEGRGETFSPTDLVATALASCMLTTMGIVARRHRWPLEGARASVEKHMAVNPVRRLGRLVVRFQMPPELPEESHRILERTAYTCPVHRSLHPDIDLDVAFDWGD